jgi:hypothetical protein
MAKSLIAMSDAELIDLISKAGSDDEVQKILLNSGRDLSDVQALNSDILGSLIENRFGTEDVKSSAALNDYLGKIKQQDYPALDEIRKIIYPNAKDLNASYGSGYFNNGTFFSNPDMDAPIRLGSTPLTNDDYTNARAKRVLGHELSHANDIPAIHLKRIEMADPEKYKQLTERIGNISKGGEEFLQHSKNIENRMPTSFADLLTPEKADILLETIKEQAPSVDREDHIRLINKYKEALLRDLGRTPDKAFIEKYIGVPSGKIPSIPGEAVEFQPKREYVTKSLESEYDPIKAEAIRSQGHHAIRKDVLEDIGHYEGRNIKRLSKGLGLLGKAVPIIGTAAAGVAALSSPDASAAAMDMAIPGGLESLGPSAEDAAIENPQRNPELRKAALQKLMGR